VRLTAEDGYQAQRSYSIASAPEDSHIELTVERIDDGEVSPFLADQLLPGDEIELRGPIGGYFAWDEMPGTPVFLVGGGSGVVPLRAMLRHHRATGSTVPVRLLYSARSLDDLIYRDELTAADRSDVWITLTRRQPAGWSGYARRVDRELVAETCWPAAERPLVYICGATGFVEAVAGALVSLGHDAARIRTERFGPTGGETP
jgi:ferredoxin-NADP reductase